MKLESSTHMPRIFKECFHLKSSSIECMGSAWEKIQVYRLSNASIIMVSLSYCIIVCHVYICKN